MSIYVIAGEIEKDIEEILRKAAKKMKKLGYTTQDAERLDQLLEERGVIRSCIAHPMT